MFDRHPVPSVLQCSRVHATTTEVRLFHVQPDIGATRKERRTQISPIRIVRPRTTVKKSPTLKWKRTLVLVVPLGGIDTAPLFRNRRLYFWDIQFRVWVSKNYKRLLTFPERNTSRHLLDRAPPPPRQPPLSRWWTGTMNAWINPKL